VLLSGGFVALVCGQSNSVEKAARAVLDAKCVSCHGEARTSDLDFRELGTILKGGKRGPAVVPGNAEALPFPDGAFGAVFSVTVIEECDADRAISEMVRVAAPGGRVGIIVRALDLPQWWNLDLPEPIRRKIVPPPQSVAGNGVADASLYRRMRRAGLTNLLCFPFLVTLDQPGGPIWRYREDHVLSLLTEEELRIWREARTKAVEEGLLMMAHPLHCAVGTKQ